MSLDPQDLGLDNKSVEDAGAASAPDPTNPTAPAASSNDEVVEVKGDEAKIVDDLNKDVGNLAGEVKTDVEEEVKVALSDPGNLLTSAVDKAKAIGGELVDDAKGLAADAVALAHDAIDAVEELVTGKDPDAEAAAAAAHDAALSA